MKVFGTASIKIRPASSGKKKPKYVTIKALVTDATTDEIFLAWKDLIQLGVVSKSFPQPFFGQMPELSEFDPEDDSDDEEEKEDQHTARKTNSENTNKLVEKYPTVFAEKLDSNRKLPGESKIYMKKDENVKPYHAKTARRPARANMPGKTQN